MQRHKAPVFSASQMAVAFSGPSARLNRLLPILQFLEGSSCVVVPKENEKKKTCICVVTGRVIGERQEKKGNGNKGKKYKP
jgi:hypothetical protein